MTTPKAIRLVAAEYLAYTINKLFPGTLLVISQATPTGFCCDFVSSHSIDKNAISLIDEAMRGMIKQEIPIEIREMMRENAADMFTFRGQPYKAECIANASENIVSIALFNGFCDFIADIPNELLRDMLQEGAAFIGAAKILSIEKAVRNMPMSGEIDVVRITGIAANDLKSLKKFSKLLDNAKEMDHQFLGKQMQYFTFHEGGCYWHPKGVVFRSILLDLWRRLIQAEGFQQVNTPLENKHAAHTAFFRSHPIRLAEVAEIRRHSTSAIQNGLFTAETYKGGRLTSFCFTDQITQEIISFLQIFEKTIRIFGFEKLWYLVVPKQKKESRTAKIEALFMQALEACGIAYLREPSYTTQALPAIEMRIVDTLGREWISASLSIDATLPDMANLWMKREIGPRERPAVLCGTIFESVDCLAALLLEKYGARLPLWLVPEQVRILTIGGRCAEFARTIASRYEEAGIRVGVDDRTEKLGVKVREAENEKIPNVIVIGEAELGKGTITVRTSEERSQRAEVKPEQFLVELLEKEAVKKV